MKKILFAIAALVAVAISSCDNYVKKEQYVQATNTSDSLAYVALQQGNEIYELSTTLKNVSDQLDAINGQIEISNGEDQSLVEKRERLLEKLATVQKNIAEKQKALDELQKKYGAELKQNKVLKQTIERLQTEVTGYQEEIAGYKIQVAEKDEQIAGLNENLSQTQQVLEETQAQSEQQQEVISTQDQMLNTAYYIVGDKNVLTSFALLEGGVLSKKRLTTKGFSADGFTKVDIRELNAVEIGTKKADVLSSHPANSYEMKTQADGTLKLVINDAAAFWSNTRYLVVKTK